MTQVTRVTFTTTGKPAEKKSIQIDAFDKVSNNQQLDLKGEWTTSQ